jgi:two-component sensor histidine kinase
VISRSDADRVAALASYDILDTPPEPEFDDLVRLIAQICEVPRAAISLIDDHRQWLKAEIGFGFRETPLDMSLCPGIELEPGLTIIPDLREDKRSASNALVVGEPHIRFYAGVMLETSDGVPLGTLCVLDDEVRDLNERQRFALVTLARQVMALLELRRAVTQRDRAIMARDEAEHGSAMLTRELHHRVKNTLAVVQAVASSSGRSATNVAQFQSALSGRIAALAKTHAVISEDPLQTATLRSLLASELAGYQTRENRVTLVGPEVSLPSETAIPLGLAIHELTSNSAKFGALSASAGDLNVSWERTRRDEGEVLVLRWAEHGGPKVEPPEREGFGTRMLGRVLRIQLGAQVASDFHPDGFRVQLILPLGPAAHAPGAA